MESEEEEGQFVTIVAKNNRAIELGRVLKWFSTSELQMSMAHLQTFHGTPMFSDSLAPPSGQKSTTFSALMLLMS